MRSSTSTVPEIDEKTKISLQTVTDNESQVIVHCYYPQAPFGSKIRIWPSTFLMDKHSNHKSQLLLADNISFMPQWTYIMPRKAHRFTLFFSGLSKECTVFDLVEDIPEPGAFIVNNIQRNQEDVYHIYL